MPRRVFIGLTAALPACAALQPLPPPTPELPRAAWEGPAPGTELTPSASGAASSPSLAKTVAPPLGAVPPAEPGGGFAPPATTAASSIPGGTTCLSELGAHRIPFHASAPVLGIATPVVLAGPLHGIRFYAPDKRPFLADCRLLLALDAVAPDLAALGVTEIRFSGAYVYKLTNPNRLSMHAFGLAADLHAFRIGGATLEVKHDFARARGAACTSGMPALNLIACRIRSRAVFKEQLGPDDNAAHFDHFHVGLKPLPGEVASDLPMPQAEPRRKTRRAHASH